MPSETTRDERLGKRFHPGKKCPIAAHHHEKGSSFFLNIKCIDNDGDWPILFVRDLGVWWKASESYFDITNIGGNTVSNSNCQVRQNESYFDVTKIGGNAVLIAIVEWDKTNNRNQPIQYSILDELDSEKSSRPICWAILWENGGSSFIILY